MLVGYDATDVADAAGWEGDPSAFIDALVSSGNVELTEDGISLVGWETLYGDLEQKRKAHATYMKERRADVSDAAPTPNGHVSARDQNVNARDHHVSARDQNVNAEKEKEKEIEKKTSPPCPPQGGRGGDGGGDAPRSEPEPEAPPDMTAEPSEAAAVDGCTLSQVIEAWNGELGPLGFPRVAKGTPARERAFHARVAERVERRDLTWWRERIAQLAASPFMCQSAREKAGWLTLDWLLNEHNIVKLTEGKYDGERIPRARDRPPETYEEAVARYRGEGSVVDAEFGEVMTCSERTSLVSSSSWPVPLT